MSTATVSRAMNTPELQLAPPGNIPFTDDQAMRTMFAGRAHIRTCSIEVLADADRLRAEATAQRGLITKHGPDTGLPPR